ncbi:uncharacterized protein LOC124181420 [Neodiprion fabricii]|uniref:uncharacterized protein LOC124181420 n=1 Tax=Neodiprion fabricii TaxID=2872261 RepID=UPI001ED8F646|nr:uncharacterized protein LOC124181420 [Neodiprion fabricii]
MSLSISFYRGASFAVPTYEMPFDESLSRRIFENTNLRRRFYLGSLESVSTLVFHVTQTKFTCRTAVNDLLYLFRVKPNFGRWSYEVEIENLTRRNIDKRRTVITASMEFQQVPSRSHGTVATRCDGRKKARVFQEAEWRASLCEPLDSNGLKTKTRTETAPHCLFHRY